MELSHEQQVEAVRSFVSESFVDRGMIAEVAVHRDDPRNPHTHILLTTRAITADGFTEKVRTWNDKEALQQ